MSKNKVKNFNEEQETEVKVNTPESEEEMEENKDFYQEDLEDDFDEFDDEEEDEQEDKKPEQPGEKVGLLKKIQGWFLKKWKWLLGLGLITVVGGVIFVYWMGKKPIKIGKVDEIAEKIKAGGTTADVIDFADAMEKAAKEMKENPTEVEVGNF